MIDRSTKAIIRETEFIRAWIAGSHREEYPSLDGWSIVDCALIQFVPHTTVLYGCRGITLVRCDCLNCDFPAGSISAVYDCTNMMVHRALNSCFLVGHPQKDGRRYVREFHPYPNESPVIIEYLAASGTDYLRVMSDREAQLRIDQIEAESQNNMSEVLA